MEGFHLGSCNPNHGEAPASDGCDRNCPRRLHSEAKLLALPRCDNNDCMSCMYLHDDEPDELYDLLQKKRS